MKELVIKARTQEFRFSLEDQAFAYTTSVISSTEFKKELPYISTYETETDNWVSRKLCDKGEQVIYLITNSINLKDQILREEFFREFEESEGIDFCPFFEDDESFNEYLERMRGDKEYLHIVLSFSELLELSLNGRSLL